MGSDEENLDDLLNLLKEEEAAENENEAAEDVAVEDEEVENELEENDIEDIEEEEIEEEEIEPEESVMDIEDLEKLLGEGMHEEGNAGADEPMGLNSDADESAVDDMGLLDFALEEEEEGLISPDEVDAMFAAADAAIANEMQSNEGEAKPEQPEEPEENSDTGEIAESLEEAPENEEESGKKKKKEKKKKEKKKKEKKDNTDKKEKKPLFGKKGKASDIAESEDREGMEDGMDSEGTGEKKPGFLAKLLSLLIETEEEDPEMLDQDIGSIEPSDENKNILEELEKEDKKKKKKKVKTQKEEEPVKEKKKKEKKPKKIKEKPAKEPGQSKDAKPGKKISKKGVLVITALCLSFMAMIIIMCSMIPDFFEKREARKAFYESDYIKAYEMLYGKQLDESDEIIYRKAETILKLDRKLDSYHNFLGIGEEVRALDSLMSGVEIYPEILAKAEEYRVTQEVNVIYEDILSVLNEKYLVSEEEARTIIGYNDVLYTKKLESLVNGTPFTEPSEAGAAEEPAEAEPDILPEEQAIIEEDIPAEPEEVLPEEEEILQGGQIGNAEPAENLPPEQAQPGEETLPEESAPAQAGSPSPGEDVSTWTGNGGFGSQGEQIQGIRQPIGVEIHGN